MSKHSRYNVARIILIFWTLFIGLGAVGGALAMLIDPTGEATGMAGAIAGAQKTALCGRTVSRFSLFGHIVAYSQRHYQPDRSGITDT